MIESVEAYLVELKRELAGSDPAVTQDALADAEEHLRNALDQASEVEKNPSEAELLLPIIEKYGSPKEIALAYQEVATLTRPTLAGKEPKARRAFVSLFFSVLSDARAWGALIYLLLSFITGIVYFTWAVTGLSLSVGLMILIFGLPVAVLVLLSIRSIALIEGRIVEALLGVRMPRRPLFTNREAGWRDQVTSLFLEGRTWTAVVYLILQLPLGVLYFTLFVSLLSISLFFMASPVLEVVFNIPLFQIGEVGYHLQVWQMPLIVVGGFLLFLVSLHLAKLIGRVHGVFAKTLLVGAR